MSDSFQVFDSTGHSERWMVDFADEQLPTLRLVSPSGEAVIGSGEDWFEALRQVRLYLEQRSLRAACAGARVDAYPSGMQRSMFLALTVYLHQPGKAAWRREYIFEPANVAECGTVAEQDAFHTQWLESPKRQTLRSWLASLDIVATWKRFWRSR